MRLDLHRARHRFAAGPSGFPRCSGSCLFIVKNRKFEYLSDGHFEAANARLKAFLHPPMPEVLPRFRPRLAAPEPPRPLLSKDAELVRVLREKLQGRAGASLRPWPLTPGGTGTDTLGPWPSWRRWGLRLLPGFNPSIFIYWFLVLPLPLSRRSRPSQVRGVSDG